MCRWVTANDKDGIVYAWICVTPQALCTATAVEFTQS